MGLIVRYLRDLADLTSGCWETLPPPNDLADAILFAREGYADVRDYLGATGFQIIDVAGNVVAEESRPF
jgi:hypothetical protein